MSFSDIYQTSTDVNGNLIYVDPETYLLSMRDPMTDRAVAQLANSYQQTRTLEEALIKEKYTKVKAKEPNKIGAGFRPMLKSQPHGMKLEEADARMPRHFRF